MNVQDQVKSSLERKRYKTRIIDPTVGEFEIKEFRTTEFSKFILSMTKFILERMNEKNPSKDQGTFIEWIKALNADDEAANTELFGILYHFLNYYLDLNVEIFGDEGFSSSRNITIAWEDFITYMVKEKEDLIIRSRESLEELPKENYEEPLTPKWTEYNFSPKDPNGKMKTMAPFCPKCFHKLARVMNIPPGSHSYELLWKDFNNEPLYQLCPKCGQRIDWQESSECEDQNSKSTWNKIKEVLTKKII